MTNLPENPHLESVPTSVPTQPSQILLWRPCRRRTNFQPVVVAVHRVDVRTVPCGAQVVIRMIWHLYAAFERAARRNRVRGRMAAKAEAVTARCFRSCLASRRPVKGRLPRLFLDLSPAMQAMAGATDVTDCRMLKQYA